MLDISGKFKTMDKNASKAFSHLDMTQGAYTKYLQSTQQGYEKVRMFSPPAPSKTIAGVPLARHEGAMQESLLHSIKPVQDGRSPRRQQNMPVKPNQQDAMSLSFQVPGTADEGARKKKVTLQEGYIRLFGQQTEDRHVQGAMGASKQLGKRIFAHDHGVKGDRTQDCFESTVIKKKVMRK